jgi:hypothetical protein
MALTLSALELALRKMMPEAKKAGTQSVARAVKDYLNQIGNPDVKFLAFSGLETADAVISDSACRVYCIFGKKPAASTTNAWLKGSDHATVAAANGDFVAKYIGTSGGGREYLVFFADGLPFGTGLTLGCHTTVNGNTKSAAADAVTGFAIVGAAI